MLDDVSARGIALIHRKAREKNLLCTVNVSTTSDELFVRLEQPGTKFIQDFEANTFDQALAIIELIAPNEAPQPRRPQTTTANLTGNLATYYAPLVADSKLVNAIRKLQNE